MLKKISIAIGSLLLTLLLCSYYIPKNYEGVIVESRLSNHPGEEYTIIECVDGYRRQIYGGVYGKVGDIVKISR